MPKAVKESLEEALEDKNYVADLIKIGRYQEETWSQINYCQMTKQNKFYFKYTYLWPNVFKLVLNFSLMFNSKT